QLLFFAPPPRAEAYPQPFLCCSLLSSGRGGRGTILLGAIVPPSGARSKIASLNWPCVRSRQARRWDASIHSQARRWRLRVKRRYSPRRTQPPRHSPRGEPGGVGGKSALFAGARAPAAALSYVAAQLSVLRSAAEAGDRAGNPALLALQRAIEADRFGIVAHVLAVRDGCRPDQC